MMQRRGFLGALAALVVAPSALLRLKVAPAPVADPSGLVGIHELLRSSSVHTLSTSFAPTWEAGYTTVDPQAAALMRQMHFQSRRAVEHIQMQLSRQFYGMSPGVLADIHSHSSVRLVRRRETFAQWERRVLG